MDGHMRHVWLLFLLLMAVNVCFGLTLIDSPGYYKLNSPISNQVTITVSNVTFDLGGYSISGATNGIIVNGNLNNIIIQNGTIASATSNGIQINGGCSDITLDTINVKNAIRGIVLSEVTNGLIQNCDFSFNTTGLQFDSCHNMVVKDCSASANKNAGYSLLTSTTCSFFNCKALGTGDANGNSSGNASFAFGFVTSNGYSNRFDTCIANSTQNFLATSYNTIVAGFAFKQREASSSIINCTASCEMTRSATGFTVPYGIWLEPILSVSQVDTKNASNASKSLTWSPDGNYLVGGVTNSAGFEITLYSLDRSTNKLQAIQNLDFAAEVYRTPWSPSGNYVGIGRFAAGLMRIYQFDHINQVLETIINFESNGGIVFDWHPSEKYVLVDNRVTSIRVYAFDPVSQTVSLAANFASAIELEQGKWQPKKENSYIFATGNGGTDTPAVRVFRFDPGAGTITQLASNNTLTGGEIAQALDWSPDGRYIIAGGGGGVIALMEWDGSSLTTINTFNIGSSIGDLVWSPNGRNFASVATNNELAIYEFDKNAGQILRILSLNIGTLGGNSSVEWSPDGEYLAIATDNGTGTNAFRLFTAYSFPTGNVITNNITYGNSGAKITAGVGISGSTISNCIINNISYNNPSNYQFATNVFNQLFGIGPSAIQNISVDYKDPIMTLLNIPQQTARIEALLESLIDNLL